MPAGEQRRAATAVLTLPVRFLRVPSRFQKAENDRGVNEGVQREQPGRNVWAVGVSAAPACAGLDDGTSSLLGSQIRHHIGAISPISPIRSQRQTPHLTLPRGYTNTYSGRHALLSYSARFLFLAHQPAREGEELSVSAWRGLITGIRQFHWGEPGMVNPQCWREWCSSEFCSVLGYGQSRFPTTKPGLQAARENRTDQKSANLLLGSQMAPAQLFYLLF